MRITFEWAKQLIFEMFSNNLDFANMKIYIVPNGTCNWRIARPQFSWISCNVDLSLFIPIEYEIIELKRIFDPINQETTRLGYSYRENIILLGETINNG